MHPISKLDRIDFSKLLIAAVMLAAFSTMGLAQTISPLFARGYTVIPEPQKLSLKDDDIQFGVDWQLSVDQSVQQNDIAVQALRDDLQQRFHIVLGAVGKSAGVVSLRIAEGSAEVGEAQDKDKQALTEQAYRIDLKPGSVAITANAPTGLFYGVETFVQLVRSESGKLWVPAGTIEDWPDLELRHIYWDDNHHLEHVEYLKQALKQAAFYKINGFVIKLNGHFQYKSAPAVVEPYALSPAELQELTDYGLRYHIQLIPYLDGPAHIAFILKHPEYAKLRAFPNSNYELCATNPESYKLLEGMYQDLLDANKGVKHFYQSTDEAYYLGLAHNSQCDETTMAKKLGSVGQVFAHFVNEADGYLHDHGRTVMFWGEYPLKPQDIAALPPYVVNGEVYGPEFDRAFHDRGIRQMIYTSVEGVEDLVPDYSTLPQSERLHPGGNSVPRVEDIFKKISFDSARANTDLIGEVDAGWGDEGLHPETFWLGYAASSAAGWHPGAPRAQEFSTEFFSLFYGNHATDMNRLYQMMSQQAQIWADTWDTVPSKSRKPIWGSSDEIYQTPKPADDQSIPLPPAPGPDLQYTSNWSAQNAKRLTSAANAKLTNEVVRGMLTDNIERSQFNRYNLEVFLSIANLCRQNLDMLSGIHEMDADLAAASKLKSSDPKKALAQVDNALDTALSIWRERNSTLSNVVATWDKSWFPRVNEANGRKVLHELDDVKDHLPDRTVDMTYLVNRERILPFGDWVNEIADVRNKYATTHNLPVRNFHLQWDDFRVESPACSSASELLANPERLPGDIDQGATCGSGS